MQRPIRDDILLGDKAGSGDGRRSAREGIERLITAEIPIALFLDIDGTLLNVALTPSSVHVPPELAGLLQSLARRLSGALAIVTGRPVTEADRLLKPLKLTAAGVHGAEMRTDPGGEVMSMTPQFSASLTASISALAKRMPGILLENKGTGISLHYRTVPEFRDGLLMALEDLRRRHRDEFAICEGRKVIEVLPIGFSKGRALRQLSALPAFSGRVPIMIGDDIADIDAFRAAEELGGMGLKVAGENFSASEAYFEGPEEVLQWLKSFEARI